MQVEIEPLQVVELTRIVPLNDHGGRSLHGLPPLETHNSKGVAVCGLLKPCLELRPTQVRKPRLWIVNCALTKDSLPLSSDSSDPS